jgi:hypothetical protein
MLLSKGRHFKKNSFTKFLILKKLSCKTCLWLFLDKGHVLVNFFTLKQHFYLPDFEELFSEIGIFRQCASVGCQKYSRILFFKLLSTQNCSQIWLIPLVNNHQCKTSQNWKKEKKNPALNIGGVLSLGIFMCLFQEYITFCRYLLLELNSMWKGF